MNKDKNFYTINRIAALSDGIFAIAMTILVLNISIPDKETVNQIGLFNALLNQGVEFYTFLLSFVLLGIFWGIQHKQMNIIQKTDSTFIWLNILLLMFICLIPFSASLESEFSSNPVSAIFFNTNMLIVGLFFMINLLYATNNHKLIPEDYSKESIIKGKKNTLIFIGVSIIALILGMFSPEYSGIAYVLIPVLKAFT
jgi:uncharacterized membrane protein